MSAVLLATLRTNHKQHKFLCVFVMTSYKVKVISKLFIYVFEEYSITEGLFFLEFTQILYPNSLVEAQPSPL